MGEIVLGRARGVLSDPDQLANSLPLLRAPGSPVSTADALLGPHLPRPVTYTVEMSLMHMSLMHKSDNA